MAQQTKQYKVLTPVAYYDRVYKEGEIIELPDASAKDLLTIRAIEPVPPPAPTPEVVPAPAAKVKAPEQPVAPAPDPAPAPPVKS